METSYNGWTASKNPADFGGISPLVVAGEQFMPGVRNGDVWFVLQYVAEQFHKRVEPLYFKGWHEADDWGYNYRANRNANNLSCHASGTAIDCNATRHPNGKRGTFTASQVTEIRKILAELEGVVFWGGDFTGTPDEMHFEIAKDPAAVKRVADKLRRGAALTTKEEDLPLSPEDIDKVAKRVWEIAIKNGFGDLVGPSQVLNGIEVRLKDVQDKLNGEPK
jgi:hypothetical protein